MELSSKQLCSEKCDKRREECIDQREREESTLVVFCVEALREKKERLRRSAQ